jgi:hypothetical protein
MKVEKLLKDLSEFCQLRGEYKVGVIYLPDEKPSNLADACEQMIFRYEFSEAQSDLCLVTSDFRVSEQRPLTLNELRDSIGVASDKHSWNVVASDYIALSDKQIARIDYPLRGRAWNDNKRIFMFVVVKPEE